MSEIRIATSGLVGLLTDLTHTAAADPACGAVAGVLLHSVRGYIGAEPGTTSLLVGTSTTGSVVGHTYAPCSGHLPPMLWPISDVRAVLAVLKPRLKDDKEHVTEISRDGDRIVVAEDPDLFGDGLRLDFGAGALTEFPRTIWALLSEAHVRPGRVDHTGATMPPAAPRTDIPPQSLAPFVKVATAHKSVVEIYRYHHRLPVLVAIGDRYRGVISPAGWSDEDREAGLTPGGDVYVPELPLPPQAAAAAP